MNLTYEYKFKDESHWSKTTNNRIEFKGLLPNSYNLLLRVKGTNEEYSLIKAIHFNIKPPFWRTVPFFLILSTLITSIILYLLRRKLKIQKKQFEFERLALKTKQEKALLEKQTIELEQKALRLQMNPHFIFNALNTIKGYYSGGNIKEANTYISRFSKLLRLILENNEHIVSLSKEIEMLELYIKLVQLRYQDVFNYRISVSIDINKEDIGIPPLLLQPIVENSIIHGLSPNSIKGNLEISFTIENKKLICSVLDNGIGIKASMENKKMHHQSKAIQITQERVQLINNAMDSDNFQLIEHNIPSGTEVIIQLPILKLW